MASASVLLEALHSAPAFTRANTIPNEFVWPEAKTETSLALGSQPYIDIPTVDFQHFRRGDTSAVEVVARACRELGFFHVCNHGVSAELVSAAHSACRDLFLQPQEQKQRARRAPGDSFGYASSFTGRFSSRLPWKETFSVQPSPVSNVSTFFEKVLGPDAHLASSQIFEEYSAAMVKLGLEILEVLGVGLGLERSSLREFFNDHSSILRLNYYPPCKEPSLTFGTGPHTDPTALTILQQDEVEGLQVYHNDCWYTVSPRNDAFVINIGDTLMALTNKRYKSCLHRALVNNVIARKSLTFFFNPAFDTLLKPPNLLVGEAHPRNYEDFTWGEFLYFTQCIHRSGINTMEAFNAWKRAQKEATNH